MGKSRPSPHSSYNNVLTRARINKGLTIQQAADAVGCTYWTLHFYERKGAVKNLDWARKMAKLYGVPMRELLGFDVLTARSGR